MTNQPLPTLDLRNADGNAFFLLGMASKVARRNGIDFEPIRKDAMSGDYDHLLQTLHKYFDVRF